MNLIKLFQIFGRKENNSASCRTSCSQAKRLFHPHPDDLETIRCQKEVGKIEALPVGSCNHSDIVEGLQGSKRVLGNSEEDRQGSSSCQEAIGRCSVSDSQKICCSGASSLERTRSSEVLSEDRQSSCHTANSHSQVNICFLTSMLVSY
jgi:hypothetical protein